MAGKKKTTKKKTTKADTLNKNPPMPPSSKKKVTKKKAAKKAAPKKEVKGEVATADITTQKGDEPEETTHEVLGVVKQDPAQLAGVRVELGHTKNIGNFESLRVSVAVSVPCLYEQGALEEAAQFAYEFANYKVTSIFHGAGLG